MTLPGLSRVLNFTPLFYLATSQLSTKSALKPHPIPKSQLKEALKTGLIFDTTQD